VDGQEQPKAMSESPSNLVLDGAETLTDAPPFNVDLSS